VIPPFTADLPGTGGLLKVAPEDFVVEEIPAYLPSGRGPHVLATIEKRGLSTFDAVRRVAAALGVAERDVGAAGLKDRQAITRQQLSLPPPVTPEAVLALAVEGVTVLSAARHENKLKTGHLRGNRFLLRIRGVDGPAADACARAAAVLARLARPPGLPNWYGEQRFGARGDNADRGRAILRGERVPARDGRERRLLVSALQSELFNRYLEARLADGFYDRVIPGDLLRKVETGGLFPSADPAVDQPRLAAGEVAPTGPMFGHAMRAPAPGTEAEAREQAILAAEGLAPADFARAARLAEGTRRAVGVPLGGPVARVAAEVAGAIEIEFTLPPGAYATVVAAEVVKSGNQR